MGDLTARAGEPLIGLVSPAFVARLEARGGRVGATLAGSWGDSGMGASRMILNLRGALRDNLVPDRYEMARGSRLLVRIAHEATLSEGPFFMGMHFGVDATTIVPPFFPVKTDEDGLWGVLLRAAFPDRLIAHLPVAVAHRPDPPRTNDPARIAVYEPRFAEFLRLLLQEDTGPGERGDRLARIGRRLCELARRPWPELRLHLKERWLAATSESVDYLEEVLVTFNRSPRKWADDVNAYIASLVSYAERVDFGLPYDIRLTDADDVVARRVAALLDAYGRLLIEWPEIFGLARARRDPHRSLTPN